jgi:hypothetical protein
VFVPEALVKSSPGATLFAGTTTFAAWTGREAAIANAALSTAGMSNRGCVTIMVFES